MAGGRLDACQVVATLPAGRRGGLHPHSTDDELRDGHLQRAGGVMMMMMIIIIIINVVSHHLVSCSLVLASYITTSMFSRTIF